MNILQLTTNSYPNFQYDGHGVKLKSRCNGEDKVFPDYKDAYVVILKIDFNTGTLEAQKNISHFSGGDFGAAMVVDQSDGSLVIAGNSGDVGMCGGLPPLDPCVAEANVLIKVDPGNLETIWQQHYLSYGEGNCTFGLLQTADNGFVLVGNNETEEGNETFNIIRYTPDCQTMANFDMRSDYIVNPPTGNVETWDASNKPSPYLVQGNIIIPPDKTLVISGITVGFASSQAFAGQTKTGITIQSGAGNSTGGRLIVRGGAILKGIECGGQQQMWDGVTVEGNPVSTVAAHQGKVTLLENALIQDARRAAVLGGTGWDTKVTDTPVGQPIGTNVAHVYNDNQAKGGGQIIASTATFRNCGKGVVWNPALSKSNLSALFNCTFDFAGPLVDPLYRASGEVPGKPIHSEVGCQIRSARDIFFTGNNFVNGASPGLFANWRERPTGIFSVNSKLSVSGGTFSNLYSGVHARSALAGLPVTVSVSSTFNSVYQGVIVQSNIAPVVSGCAFNNVPDAVDINIDGVPAGMYSSGTQGILLANSTFSSDANFTSFGSLIKDSGEKGGAEMRDNTFSNFYVASRFEQDNSQMITDCNTYQGAVGRSSWEVQGTFNNQGSLLDANDFPDNKFLTDCDQTLLDIRSTTAFTYKERQISPVNINSIVLCVSPAVNVQHFSADPNPDCSSSDPCPDPPNCEGLMAKYNQTGQGLRERNQLLQAYTAWDSSEDPNASDMPGVGMGVTLLSGRNQQEDKRILLATHISIGNYAAAQTLLPQIVGTDEETQDFLQLNGMLINAGLAGRDLWNLTASDFQQVADLLHHTTAAGAQVKVLDHILNGNYHPLYAEPSSGGRSSDEGFENKEKTGISGLSVYPNPFRDAVLFEAASGLSVAHIIVTDASGKIIFDETKKVDTQRITWQPEPGQQGIFFYRCTLSDGTEWKGKILKFSGNRP